MLAAYLLPQGYHVVARKVDWRSVWFEGEVIGPEQLGPLGGGWRGEGVDAVIFPHATSSPRPLPRGVEAYLRDAGHGWVGGRGRGAFFTKSVVIIWVGFWVRVVEHDYAD